MLKIQESNSIISVGEVATNILSTSMDNEVLMQALSTEELSGKIKDLQATILGQKKVLEAYQNHYDGFKKIHTSHHGKGGQKIWKSLCETDFVLDRSTGKITSQEGTALKTKKNGWFGKRYTHKEALTTELERLKQKMTTLKKDIAGLESDLKEATDKRKVILDEISSHIQKKLQPMTSMNQKV